MPRKKKPSSSESDDDGLVTSERLQNRDLFDPQISGDEDEELAEDEWEVERILDKRFDTTRRCYEYRVKWKGYEDKHNSWEPEDNLTTCPEMIKQFEERQERIRFRKALKSEARGKANYRSDSESLSDFITDDDDSDANKKEKKHLKEPTIQKQSSQKRLGKLDSESLSDFVSNDDSDANKKEKKHMKESTFKKQASQKQLGKFAGNSSQSKSQKKDVKNTGIKNLSLSSQRKVMKKRKVSTSESSCSSLSGRRNDTNEPPKKRPFSIKSSAADLRPRMSKNEKENKKIPDINLDVHDKDSGDEESKIPGPLQEITYRVVGDNDNGFTRKWKIEKILAFNKRRRDDISCAIIKFKGYKIMQQIPLVLLKDYDGMQFTAAYRSLVIDQYRH